MKTSVQQTVVDCWRRCFWPPPTGCLPLGASLPPAVSAAVSCWPSVLSGAAEPAGRLLTFRRVSGNQSANCSSAACSARWTPPRRRRKRSGKGHFRGYVRSPAGERASNILTSCLSSAIENSVESRQIRFQYLCCLFLVLGALAGALSCAEGKAGR